MTDPLLDIRIGTMVKANAPDPAAYIRSILQYGFESFQPYFWQTMGGKDIKHLAGEIKDAIGDTDVKVSALGMFGNPLEDKDLDRETLTGWKTLIDNAHLFGDQHRHRLHRPRPRQADARQSATLQRGLGRTCQARRRQGRPHRLRELRHGRHLGERRLEHRPQSRRVGADVQRAPVRQPRPRVGALPPDGQADRPDAAAPQVGKKIFHVHGKDATVRWDVIREHGIYGKVALRATARPASATATGPTSSPSCASPASRARSTSKAGTTRSIAAISK